LLGELEAVDEPRFVKSSHAVWQRYRANLIRSDRAVRSEEEPPLAVPKLGEAGDVRTARERREPGRSKCLVHAPVRFGRLVRRESVEREDATRRQVRTQLLEPVA